MATYRTVEVPGASMRRWAIERTVPGERPETLPFRGTRGAARAEIVRLRERDRMAPPSGDSVA